MRGVTESGFEWDVDVEKLDDWDVLELLSDMEDGNLLSAPKLLRKVLGEKAKDLIEHCRQENGTAPTKVVLDEVLEIFNTVKEGKN